MQDALRKERKRLEKVIEEKEKERRTLHLDELGAMKKRIEELEQTTKQQSVKKKNTEAPRYKNRQGFWHTCWKCLVCRRRTTKSGKWTCRHCETKHLNVH